MDGFVEFLSQIPFPSFSFWEWVLCAVVLSLVCLFVHDLLQKKNPIWHNFPVFGHFRQLGISLGPVLRQYIVANNREELPFNRREREWIESSAAGENNYFGFGSDDQLYGTGYPIILHHTFPYGNQSFAHSISNHKFNLPCVKVIGEAHGRKRPFRPASIINVSGMSYGALSSRATEAINLGAKLSKSYHNTGEGGISPYHKRGADLVMQIGTGYFGVRSPEGRFSFEALKRHVDELPELRALEIKLSQGAKPGKGGVLPGRKVTREISQIRMVPIAQDCISPNAHSEFTSSSELIDFIERVADASGLPVGIKSAVGQKQFWYDLTSDMKRLGGGPDFITIDGGEGGTGAAPISFADHVSLPFKHALTLVYQAFQERGLSKDVAFIGSAKLGFPDRAVVAFAMGIDCVNIAREAMLSIGCIQAQQCHTDHCPSGIATHKRFKSRGIDVEAQGLRFSRYIESFRKEVQLLANASGLIHPSQFSPEHIALHTSVGAFDSLGTVHGYAKDPMDMSTADLLDLCGDSADEKVS